MSREGLTDPAPQPGGPAAPSATPPPTRWAGSDSGPSGRPRPISRPPAQVLELVKTTCLLPGASDRLRAGQLGPGFRGRPRRNGAGAGSPLAHVASASRFAPEIPRASGSGVPGMCPRLLGVKGSAVYLTRRHGTFGGWWRPASSRRCGSRLVVAVRFAESSWISATWMRWWRGRRHERSGTDLRRAD
jgi:hypothetical protein